MKWLVALFVSACACAHADQLRVDALQLGEMGAPFENPKVVIVWTVQTNRVPSAMKLYRVVPAKFSIQLMTNLIAMGGFKEPEKVKNAMVPALRGKDTIWEEVPAHKTITVSPRRGKAQFFNTSRIPLPGEPEHGLPADDEALKLALQTAKTLGLATAEFARSLDSDQFLIRRSKRERSGLLNGKYTKRDISRGIYLYRAFDGVPVYGNGNCGGLYVNFGNDAQVAEVDLSWRSVEVEATLQTADRNQIAKWIKEGKAYFADEDVNPAKVKKLIIRDIVAHYRGFSTEEEQAMVVPMAVIQATAESKDGATSIMLLCPIIDERSQTWTKSRN
jgi:hypothetical protein